STCPSALTSTVTAVAWLLSLAGWPSGPRVRLLALLPLLRLLLGRLACRRLLPLLLAGLRGLLPLLRLTLRLPLRRPLLAGLLRRHAGLLRRTPLPLLRLRCRERLRRLLPGVLAAGQLEEQLLQVGGLLLHAVERHARLGGDVTDLLHGGVVDGQPPVLDGLHPGDALLLQRGDQRLTVRRLHQDPALLLLTQVVELAVVHRLPAADDHHLVDCLLELGKQV